MAKLDIRSIRKDLHMSQTAFAKALGVDQSTVSAWERNGLPKNALVRDAVDRRIAAMRIEAGQGAPA